MMTNYVIEREEELRECSTGPYHPILASLSPEVVRRYGHVQVDAQALEQKLRAAADGKAWLLVADLSFRLPPTGRRPWLMRQIYSLNRQFGLAETAHSALGRIL